MKYVAEYDLYIDDDLIIYAYGTRDDKQKNTRKGFLHQLTPRKDKTGYMRVSLCRNGKKQKYAVHRIIALAFIPNPERKPVVDHINRDRSDNRLSNLHWATYKENMDNTKAVDRGIQKFGVRCCEDVRAYNHEYGKLRKSKRK